MNTLRPFGVTLRPKPGCPASQYTMSDFGVGSVSIALLVSRMRGMEGGTCREALPSLRIGSTANEMTGLNVIFPSAFAQEESTCYEPSAINFHLGETPPRELWEREPTEFVGAISGELHCHWSNNPAPAAAASQSLASSLIMAANSAGEFAILSSPFSPSTCCMSAELRIRTTSSCKRAVIGAGRFGGPSKPIQVRPGTKRGISSATVGTSGSFA